MSTLTEITPLEGIDLHGTPPCDIIYFGFLCGKPSAFRVITICSLHGQGRKFACRRCHDELAAGKGLCTVCWSPRPLAGYC